MIKILRPGTLQQIDCSNCGALLSYDEATDVQESTLPSCGSLVAKPDYSLPKPIQAKEYYIVCPQCNNKIILSATR
jgi:DNA-directed RNA polymerase subunit RPC12/RpoP